MKRGLVKIREYKNEDYALLSKWWKAHDWEPPAECMLPVYGLICNEIAAGFMYSTDSKLFWVEWFISDPDSDPEQRNRAVDIVVDKLCDYAKISGAKAVFSSTNKPSFENRLLKHGFVVGDKNTTQLIKGL